MKLWSGLNDMDAIKSRHLIRGDVRENPSENGTITMKLSFRIMLEEQRSSRNSMMVESLSVW